MIKKGQCRLQHRISFEQKNYQITARAMRHDKEISPVNNKDHGRIVSSPKEGHCLDTAQLNLMEQAFRLAVENAPRPAARFSRQRILVIFLLIRYTGAKLSEVLAVNPLQDIDANRHSVLFRGGAAGIDLETREVQISETLAGELHNFFQDPSFREATETVLGVDPGFVRRKFYQCAEDCGFARQLGGPEAIRKARAIELMQGNMPLPAVQLMLGHSTPNLTSSYVSFSEEEIRQVARLFMEKESLRKTSARNSFFGKIETIEHGDIQARIVLTTIDGHRITTVITSDSVERLGLKKGRLISAEVKAPWVILQSGSTEPACSAENRIKGVVERITRGKINTECVVRISPTTEVCAVVSSGGSGNLDLHEGDEIWVMFTSFSVVLHVD
jgi:molybdate transport system regulatory protein